MPIFFLISLHLYFFVLLRTYLIWEVVSFIIPFLYMWFYKIVLHYMNTDIQEYKRKKVFL
jgi:hypothetical protein